VNEHETRLNQKPAFAQGETYQELARQIEAPESSSWQTPPQNPHRVKQSSHPSHRGPVKMVS
jgi:hypothetical protein